MADAPQEQEFAQEDILEMEDTRVIVVCAAFSLVTFSLLIWLSQLPGSTETAASFQFDNEGHTFGNALRFAIMKKWDSSLTAQNGRADLVDSPNVEFCGYTIPHPSEMKMNLRIQTYGMFVCPLLALGIC